MHFQKGILCAKKRLFQNYVPVVPGGGTVFVAYGIEDGEWDYLDNIEEKEEGGTPDIIGSVRASFTFMVKDHITTEYIEQTEQEYLAKILKEKKLCFYQNQNKFNLDEAIEKNKKYSGLKQLKNYTTNWQELFSLF